MPISTRLRLVALERRDTPAAPGGLAVAAGDLNGDGLLDLVTGAGQGGGPHVRSYRVATTTELTLDRSVFPFDPGFRGGVNVAVGDVDGDGKADIIAAAGPGGGPHVRVLSGRTGAELMSFMAYPVAIPGGVNVAAEDLDGDGRADVITAPGAGGGPHVRVFSGRTGALLREFFAYDPAFTGGVNLAAADATGDGKADVVTGPGAGGGPHVQLFSGAGLLAGATTPTKSFFAYDSGFTGGVNVAMADLDNNGKADIVTAPASAGGPHVRAFGDATGAVIREFLAYPATYTGGVTLAAGDATGDGRADILTMMATGGFEQLPGVFNGTGGAKVASPVLFSATAQTFDVAGGKVYFPSGMQVGVRVPMLVAFSPDGLSDTVLGYLKPHAEQRKWLVFGSSDYRNSDVGPMPSDATVVAHIMSARTVMPADATRLIFTGPSGGGLYAHALNLDYPGLAAALVVNTGMAPGVTIPEGTFNGTFNFHSDVTSNAAAYRQQFTIAGSRQIIAFLASTTDFRYEEMQRDYGDYGPAGLNWTRGWFLHDGGHVLASTAQYAAMFDWLTTRPTWA